MSQTKVSGEFAESIPASSLADKSVTTDKIADSALSNHQAKLRDTTGSADLLLGSSEIVIQGSSSAGSSGASYISGRFMLSVESDIEVQHQCATTANNNGFGAGAGFGTEVFTDIKIWKIG